MSHIRLRHKPRPARCSHPGKQVVAEAGMWLFSIHVPLHPLQLPKYPHEGTTPLFIHPSTTQHLTVEFRKRSYVQVVFFEGAIRLINMEMHTSASCKVLSHHHRLRWDLWHNANTQVTPGRDAPVAEVS